MVGDVPCTPARLVSAINVGFPFGLPQGDQTMFLRRTLEMLGKSLNCRIRFDQRGRLFESDRPSLNLSWWQPGTGTTLAVTCEWGLAGDVANAFERLMAVKAPMKLLIFCTRQAGNERRDILLRTDTDAVLKAIGASIIDFGQHFEGELYVLLESVQQTSMFRSYEFRVPTTGKLAVNFERASCLFSRTDCTSSAACHDA